MYLKQNYENRSFKIKLVRSVKYLMSSKNTFRQGVCNDGGSDVEMSSICAVPLALYRLVVSSITWGIQAQPLYKEEITTPTDLQTSKTH